MTNAYMKNIHNNCVAHSNKHIAAGNASLRGHHLDQDEEIPPGGWRTVVDDEEIPPGGWRAVADDEEIPPGGWRAVADDEEIPLGEWCPPRSELPISCAAELGNRGVLPAGRRAVGREDGGILPPGGFRAAYVDTYRTKDGCARFQFRFVEDRPGVVEMDILSSPSYGFRSEDLHFTHRLPSSRGGYRVCLAHPEAAYSFAQAKKFAKSWAESTWRYIKHGLTF
jgi:hypothetical protein